MTNASVDVVVRAKLRCRCWSSPDLVSPEGVGRGEEQGADEGGGGGKPGGDGKCVGSPQQDVSGK